MQQANREWEKQQGQSVISIAVAVVGALTKYTISCKWSYTEVINAKKDHIDGMMPGDALSGCGHWVRITTLTVKLNASDDVSHIQGLIDRSMDAMDAMKVIYC